MSIKRLTDVRSYSNACFMFYRPNKTHQGGFQMRPIISGIGFARHKLAKTMTNVLTPRIKTISPLHIMSKLY